ncbi:MAG TPA: GAF domain-containing SpoIIE family protein phosphatase [Candidatus Tumulicola sp.]|jgi:serine phosphatase RsbU (regulator of sigma subunit)
MTAAAHGDHVFEPARLQAVFASGLLDSERESAFDDLTALAATVIGVPFAFATVVDSERSFWKSAFGIPPDGPHQNTVEESFCQYVVRSQGEVVVFDAAIDERTRTNSSVRSMGVRAWAGVPLRGPSGEVLGSFCAVDTVPKKWTQEDLDVLRTLARSASREVALRSAVNEEHEARLRAELLAHTLQQSLLPPTLTQVEGLDIGACFQPAGHGLELGGDFYDVFQSGGDVWTFVIGDVCGKGIDAARIATLARYTVGAGAMRTQDPSQVLAWLHETLIARATSSDRFLTAIVGYLRLDDDGCNILLANGGHVPAIVRRANGDIETLHAPGTIVGSFVPFSSSPVKLRLRTGDSIVLYTDGVSEARCNGIMFGEDAVRSVVAAISDANSSVELTRRLVETALAYEGGTAQDDMAVLALKPTDRRLRC